MQPIELALSTKQVSFADHGALLLKVIQSVGVHADHQLLRNCLGSSGLGTGVDIVLLSAASIDALIVAVPDSP